MLDKTQFSSWLHSFRQYFDRVLFERDGQQPQISKSLSVFSCNWMNCGMRGDTSGMYRHDTARHEWKHISPTWIAKRVFPDSSPKKLCKLLFIIYTPSFSQFIFKSSRELIMLGYRPNVVLTCISRLYYINVCPLMRHPSDIIAIVAP